MKRIFLLLTLLATFSYCFSQQLDISPAKGFPDLGIGDSYEKVQSVIGFGKLKTYNQYVSEELFDRDPEKTLECLLGFDHYMKFEHLIPLPVLYIFFKNDKVSQIVTTSFPEYYRAICEDVSIKEKISFWDNKSEVKSALGTANIVSKDEYRILDSFVYLDQGISLDFREDQLRIAHIFKVPDPSVGNPILNKLAEK